MALIRPIPSKGDLDVSQLSQNLLNNTTSVTTTYTCTGSESGRIMCAGMTTHAYQAGSTLTVTLNGTDISSTGITMLETSGVGKCEFFNLNLHENDVISVTCSTPSSSSYISAYIIEL